MGSRKLFATRREQLRQKNSAATRGKYAEEKTQEYLEQLKSKYAAFDYERIYDARSAGGRFPKRPGDFEFYAPKLHGLIEAKEVEHDFRLASARLTQIPKLRKRELAGGLIFVLVYHGTTGRWRSVPLNWLQQRIAQPSWDLREFPEHGSVEIALAPLVDEIEFAIHG
jgi:hypothetical protein